VTQSIARFDCDVWTFCSFLVAFSDGDETFRPSCRSVYACNSDTSYGRTQRERHFCNMRCRPAPQRNASGVNEPLWLL